MLVCNQVITRLINKLQNLFIQFIAYFRKIFCKGSYFGIKFALNSTIEYRKSNRVEANNSRIYGITNTMQNCTCNQSALGKFVILMYQFDRFN